MKNDCTYNISDAAGASDEYYKVIKICVDNFLNSMGDFDAILDDYSKYIFEFGNIKKNKLECIIEFLSCASLYRIYFAKSQNINYALGLILKYCVIVRKKNRFLKHYIDKIRGMINGMVISHLYSLREEKILYSHINFGKFILWLYATGEFNQEATRFEYIKKYMHTKNSAELQSIYKMFAHILNDFDNIRQNMLCGFTENIAHYIAVLDKDSIWREDWILRQRREEEYHLNMFAAEILNRAYRNNFEKTSRRILVLPVCMRKHSADKCKAVSSNKALLCRSCDKNCNISIIKKIGETKNFETVIIPHSSSLSKWGKQYHDRENIGAVGVACPLSLLGGGWELNSMEFPAQCVLLNFSGCKSHWTKGGVSTTLDIDELLKRIV